MENICPTCGQRIPQKSYPNKVFITTKALNVRASSDTSSGVNILGKLSYGEEVEPLSLENGWYKISYNGKEGWISSEYTHDVAEKPMDGDVNFKIGIPNDSKSQNAIIIRKAINDEFGGGKNNWNLQCVEYVHYKIKNLGCNIDWPVHSGRDGGKWAGIFLAQGKYSVSMEPTINCAMSFTGMPGYGHVAFVENVLPDGSVKISEANWPGDGKYNERTVNKIMQQKYGAKYIKFI
ncbi:MAG: CHAP domain-containing protein [Patescibacteria group bacterium]